MRCGKCVCWAWDSIPTATSRCTILRREKSFCKIFAKFFGVFAKFFKVFASFFRFSRAFRGFRIHSDPLGCIRTHSEAIGSVWTFSKIFEIFWIFESFFNVSGRNFYKRLFSRHNKHNKKETETNRKRRRNEAFEFDSKCEAQGKQSI